MPKTRPPYPPEFERRLVEQVYAGRTPEELAATDIHVGRKRIARLMRTSGCGRGMVQGCDGAPVSQRDR